MNQMCFDCFELQNVWYLGPLTITMFNWPWQELSRLRTGQPKEIKRRFVLRLEFFARVFWLWKMCQKSLHNNRLTLFTRLKFGNPSKFYSLKWRVPWWYNTLLTACSRTAAIDESNCTLKSSLAKTPLGKDKIIWQSIWSKLASWSYSGITLDIKVFSLWRTS